MTSFTRKRLKHRPLFSFTFVRMHIESMSDKSPWFSQWFNTRYYHILYGHRDGREAHAFIDRLHSFVSKTGGFQREGPMRVLDLACGSGRHARAFNLLGCAVTGLDLAQRSIDEARSTGPDAIQYHVGDMRHFKLGKSFEVITNLFTSFGYFDDEADNLKVLQAVKSHLVPQGIFVLDFLNVEKAIRGLVSTEVIERNGLTFNIRRRVDDAKIIKEITFHDGDDFFFEERVQALTVDRLRALMNRAELEVINVFGDYKLATFDALNSPRAIVVARNS